MERSLPPSARRLELARRAGLVLTSPAAAAALALLAAIAAAVATVGVAARALASLARAGWATAADGDPVARALATDAAAVTARAATASAPVLLAAALAALLATALLARGLVVPRRRLRGAPTSTDDDVSARVTDALVAVVRATVLGAVALAFVLDRLPAIAALAGRPATELGPFLRTHALAALAHMAVAAIAASALEVLVRAARRRGDLRMTVREARDELRETAGDPSARRRRQAARTDPRAAVADAVVVLGGDQLAVAIGWRRGADPTVLTRGRGLEALAVRAAARARQVPLAFAPALAAALPATGAVPAAHQPALASLLASLSLSPR